MDGSFTVDIAFSEDVLDVGSGDFTVSNGTVTALSGSDADYQLEVTPDGGGRIHNILGSGVTDLTGNTQQGSIADAVVAYELLRVLTIIIADHAVSDTVEVTVSAIGSDDGHRTETPSRIPEPEPSDAACGSFLTQLVDRLIIWNSSAPLSAARREARCAA